MSNQYGEFVEQTKKTVEGMLTQVHTCVPGKVVSFDGSTCQATVLPSMKIKTPKGEMVDYPQITGVPVVFPQSSAQGVTIAYPVKAGGRVPHRLLGAGPGPVPLRPGHWDRLEV